MTRSTMKWLAPYLLALLALASPTRRAEAQLSQGINRIEIDNEKLEVTAKININGSQCGGEFVFELNNVQPRVPVMEVWATATQGVNCALAASRANAIAGQKSQCWKVESKQNVLGNYEYPVRGSLIFNEARAAREEDSRECDTEASDKPYWVYFVPLRSATQPDTPNVAEPLTPVVMTATFYLSAAVPDAPTGLKVTGGETRVLAKWDGIGDPTRGSQAFFDIAPEVVGDDDCTSSLLVGAGNNVTVDKVRVFTTGRLSKTSASLDNLEAKGVPLGGRVAVAVAQVDLAGNIGTLTEVQCATRVATTSAIDACGTLGDCGLETCGLSPASRGSWFGLSLYGLFIAALIRRRTA
jgi:hypothetical protein